MAIATICILCMHNLHIGTMCKQYAYCASNIYIECAVWLLRQYAYYVCSLDIGIMNKQYAYCASNIHTECAVWLLHGNLHIAYAQFRYRDDAQAIYLLCCEQQAVCKPCGVVTNNSNCVYDEFSRTYCIDS